MTLPFRYLQMSSMTDFIEKITITGGRFQTRAYKLTKDN